MKTFLLAFCILTSMAYADAGSSTIKPFGSTGASYFAGAIVSQRDLFKTLDADYNCSKVISQWSFDHDDGYTIVVLCEPRPLKQKQILSLQRSCETQPNQECFSEKVIQYMDQYQETQYVNMGHYK